MPHCTHNFAWYLGKFILGFAGMLFLYVGFLKETEPSCLCGPRRRELARRKGEKTDTYSTEGRQTGVYVQKERREEQYTNVDAPRQSSRRKKHRGKEITPVDVAAPNEHPQGGRNKRPSNSPWLDDCIRRSNNRKVSSTKNRCCGWNNVKSRNSKYLTNARRESSKHCPLHCPSKGLFNIQWLEAESDYSRININDTDSTGTSDFSRSYCKFTRRKDPNEEMESRNKLKIHYTPRKFSALCCNCKSKKLLENEQLRRDEDYSLRTAPEKFPKVCCSESGMYSVRNCHGRSICIPCKRETLNDDYAILAGENASKNSEGDQLPGNTSTSDRTSTTTENKPRTKCFCGRRRVATPEGGPRPRRPWTSAGESKFPVFTKTPGKGSCCIPVTQAESYLAVLKERLRLKESLKRLRVHLEKQNLENQRLSCREKIINPETASSGGFSGGSGKRTPGERVERRRIRICSAAKDPADDLEVLYSSQRSSGKSASRKDRSRHCPT